MFRNALLEELAIMFGESISETFDTQNNTNESIYINYAPVQVKVNDDAKITFVVPFDLTIYADRNDFCFGYLSTKFSMYKPNAGQRRIVAIDDYETPFWNGDQVLGITKAFNYQYDEDFNRQIEKLKKVDF
ncbi:TPA: hypothetical protein ACMD15_003394 [Vibrio cholerae]